MTVAELGYRGVPWTEEDYLALGDTTDRVELLDGGLIVTPAPTPYHQHISRRLANLLDGPAQQRSLEVYEAVNVRLRRGRIPIPDLVVVTPIDQGESVIAAASVRLIAEIVSPSNPANDRVLKMQLYAEAGIPWYLLVEPDANTIGLSLFGLDDGHYTLRGSGAPGAPLDMVEPVTISLVPELLHRPH